MSTNSASPEPRGSSAKRLPAPSIAAKAASPGQDLPPRSSLRGRKTAGVAGRQA